MVCSGHMGDPCEQIDKVTENITFPQLYWWAVNMPVGQAWSPLSTERNKSKRTNSQNCYNGNNLLLCRYRVEDC